MGAEPDEIRMGRRIKQEARAHTAPEGARRATPAAALAETCLGDARKLLVKPKQVRHPGDHGPDRFKVN